MTSRLVVLQPSYLPWLGYLDQYHWADHFVLYDDVQYDKHGWRNRNRIKTVNGLQWLTVPVLTKNLDKPSINEVQINNQQKWTKKHLQSIKQAYSKCEHFDWLYPSLEEVLSRPFSHLCPLNVELLRALTELLGMPWKVRLSSELGVPGRRTERLVGICQQLGATDYLTGDAARDYLEEDRFEEIGVRVHWHSYQHPTYRQRFDGFEPYLSVIDLMFNHGPESLEMLAQSGKEVRP